MYSNEKRIISNFPNWLFIFTFAILANSTIAYILLNFFDFEMYPDYYHVIAQNLLNGKGYIISNNDAPVVWRPPLYPLFLAAIYFIFGIQHLPVVIAQILINSFTSVLIYKLMKRIFSPNIGICSALIYSLYPFAAYYLVRELPLIMFNFLLIILIHTMYRFYDEPNWINAFLFGVIQGILILTKLFFKGFPFFVILYILIAYIFRFSFFGGIKKPFQLVFMMILGLSIILTPWIIRNYKIVGDFPVIGVGGGFTMWVGNNIHFDGKDYDQLPIYQVFEMRKEVLKIIGDGSGIDYKNDRKLFDETIRNFIRYPKETGLLMAKKIFRLWFSPYSLRMQKYVWLVTIFQTMIILPGLLGIFLALKYRIRICPLLLILFYFQIVYTLFAATIRYCIPVMPIVISFAVYGISKCLSQHNRRSDCNADDRDTF